MSTEVSFEDEATVKAAFADVRNDAVDITYAICEHVDGRPDRLRLLCTGTDTSELGSKMDSADPLYILARYDTQFDLSVTTKFVYIMWQGGNISLAKRGKFGVVSGSIEGWFSPYHVSISASSTEDLNPESIKQTLMETSGTKSKVLDTAADVSSRQERGFTATQLPKRDQTSKFAVSAVAAKGAGVEIQPDVYEAVAKVRQDFDSATWMLAGYEGSNPKGPVTCMHVGEGTLSDLKAGLDDALPMYGLYRHEHTDADNITTVKFVYIAWVGTKVKPMTRAKISTQKGTFEEIFCPSHVTVFASELSDIDEADILEKIKQQGSC